MLLLTLAGTGTLWSVHMLLMVSHLGDQPLAPSPLRVVHSILLMTSGLFVALVLAVRALGKRALFGAGSVVGLTLSAVVFHDQLAFASGFALQADLGWVMMTVGTSILIGGCSSIYQAGPPNARRAIVSIALLVGLMSVTHLMAMYAMPHGLSVADPGHNGDLTEFLLFAIIGVALSVISFAALLGLFLDARLELRQQKALRAMTSRDGLTGLPNSIALSHALVQLDKRGFGPDHANTCLVSIDLDRFCDINDEFGYAAGDAVLCKVARRLTKQCQGTAEVFHLGSDQFFVLCNSLVDSNESAPFVEGLVQELTRPVTIAGMTCKISPSVGFACTPYDAPNIQDARKCAELALHRVKSTAGREVGRFDAELDRKDRARRALGEDLRTALSQGEFYLVYQAQTALSTHATSGFEALLRWNHPLHGAIPPDEFVPLAEANGAICDIGMWVIRTACQEAASWNDPFTVAVNVAPQQLHQPDFHREVAEILHQTGLQPWRLELEITENSIIADAEGVRVAMRRLQAIGVRIALDDFGTGYASMATLQAFPFNKLKLDRCFVADVHLDPQKAAIVKATVLLGNALDVPVLAEGVEVPQELAFLKSEGCVYAQGFLMGTPMSVDELRLLVNGRAQISRAV